LPTKRLSRPELFMHIASLYASRSTCRRASVGAVAIRDGRVVAAGYCGAPTGQPHCLDKECVVVDGHCTRSVHAEANLVSWAARTGTPLEDVEIYCTHFPCLNCAKLLRNAGVRYVVWEKPYESQSVGDSRAVAQLIVLKEYRYFK